MTQRESRRAAALLLLCALYLAAAGSLGAEGIKVAATTEWTAAFCRLAGINEVHVLAPANLQHPPDYELRPSDIPVIMESDLIVFGGYEGMMRRIRSNTAGGDTELLQIRTVNSEAFIRESVLFIAEAAGTVPEAEKNLEELDEVWKEARSIVEDAGQVLKKSAVHFHLGDFAWTMGLFEVASFGPAPPGPALISEIAGSGAALIVDNAHNPRAAALREVLPDADVVELINFPGRFGTSNLEDVILHNARLLAAAGE